MTEERTPYGEPLTVAAMEKWLLVEPCPRCGKPFAGAVHAEYATDGRVTRLSHADCAIENPTTTLLDGRKPRAREDDGDIPSEDELERMLAAPRQNDLPRLVHEVARLRALILEAYPHVPEREHTRDLVARLKAEVDR